MSDSAGLERRYRRLLACYPRAFRRENSEEILAVLLACAQDGQRRPGFAASADLIRGAVRMRLRLARVDDARREFIANASHELRTPIFSLGGFLELFRDEELDEATRHEFLDTMTEQVERLSKLATDLLDLSRLDAGPVRLEREPVELADVAEDLCEEFAAVARRRGAGGLSKRWDTKWCACSR